MTTTIDLLTLHFEHPPIAFVDDIINAVHAVLYRMMPDIEMFVRGIEQNPLDGVHKLETLLEHAIDRAFDAFELYVLRNIFAVPADIQQYLVLVEYKDFECVVDENIDKHMDYMRESLAEATNKRRKLQKELLHSRKSLSQVAAYAEQLVSTPETALFLADQVSTLQTLLLRLSTRTLSLQHNPRTDYINSFTEKSLPQESVANVDRLRDIPLSDLLQWCL